MEPDPLNFNQQFRSGSLPAAHGNLGRYLTSEQAGPLPGLGLGTFPHPSLTSAAARSFGPLPGYGHPQHSLVSPLQDNLSQLQSMAAQSQYRSIPVGQSAFPFGDTSIRASSADPYLSRLSSQASKPLFTQETHALKSTAGLTQASPTLDTAPKAWGLSNFVPSTTNPFTNLPTDLSSGEMSLTSPTPVSAAPPPAHSSKRTSTIQRNPFTGNELFSPASRGLKSPTSYSSSLYGYNRVLDSRAVGQTGPSTLISHTNTDPSSQSGSMYSVSESNSVKTEPSVYSMAEMDYDPVSPATPLSDAGQQSDTYMSLQDLTSINNTHEKLTEIQEGMMITDPTSSISNSGLPIQQLHSLQTIHNLKTKTSSVQQDLFAHHNNMNPGTPNGQMYSVKQSPTQQSAISVGGSPQTSLPAGSPQTAKPSSTIVPAPPPIQAPADSTTKPKRRRKKKESVSDLKKDSDMVQLCRESQSPIYQQPMLKQQVSEQGFTRSADLKRQISEDSLGNPSPVMQDTSSLHRGLQSDGFMSGQSFMSTSGNSQAGNYVGDNVIRGSVNTSVGTSQSSLLSQQAQILGNKQTQLMGHNHQAFGKDQIMGQKSSSIGALTQQSQYVKDDSSPSFVPQLSPVQLAHQESPVPQQSVVATGYQSSSPLTSHSTVHYSVSEALEMTENGLVGIEGESVFDNSSQSHHHSMLEGYEPTSAGGMVSSDMVNAFEMQDGGDPNFSSPLGMTDNMTGHTDQFHLSHGEGMYTTNAYGGPFVSPNVMLNMDPSLTESSAHGGPTSTIDEAAFSSLMDESVSREPSPEKVRYRTKAEQKQMPFIPLTVKIDVEYDDDFRHLSTPVTDQADSDYHGNKTHFNSNNQQSVLEPQKSNPEVKCVPKGPSFLDSFLNFVQGKKPETLSSMTNAVIHNKPQLPKYIPEPPRRRRPPDPAKSDDSSSNTPKPDLDSKSESGSVLSHASPPSRPTSQNSVVTFSGDDEEDEHRNIDSAVQKAIMLGGENDKVKISTNRSGGLTMKINLAKVKASTEAKARKSSKSKQKKSTGKSKKGKSKSRHRDFLEAYDHGYSSGEEVAGSPVIEKPVIPPRQTSSRKAKDNSKKKYDFTESDEDSDLIHEIRKPGEESDEDRNYDSDRDPAWTPFSVKENKTPGYDIVAFSDRPKKSRSKGKGKGKSGNSRKTSSEKSMSVSSASLDSMPTVAKLVKLNEPVELNDTESEDDQKDGPTDEGPLQMGDFVMEKKDLKNFESYPIWKIESGRMLHKFELYTDESKILHRAVPTFSSWLPSMRSTFLHIRVKQIYKQKDKDVVEVLENYRPKPVLDSKLETEYEEHPLVDVFNIYLQIFLSQALEPGFLSAIRESNDSFYLEPLQKIDAAIENQLQEIDSKVKWRAKFQESVKARPHIRELDRPNLKQSCQACEFASQPAIKSIHLFGNPYCRYSLVEQSQESGPPSQEFMIGKTASRYVKSYHNLYHFKYNLYKRCLAKINLLQDSSEQLENAAVLDKCLQNRAWVLQIFEDLKKLLEKG